MSWTTERVDLLKNLWSEGQSASAIATKLGEVTRNAVIGKVHRLGLAGRASKSRRPRSPRTSLPAHRDRSPFQKRSFSLPASSRPRSVSVKTIPAELGPEPEIPVIVETLTERTCRWPEGDPKLPGFHFCGRTKTATPGPYCGHHAAIAYR